MAASKIAQYALIETSLLPVCYSRHLSILHTPRQRVSSLVHVVQEMVALAWGTTLRKWRCSCQRLD